jgi:hypothetical protein
MGDSFYHIFTTPYLFLLTLFFGRHGVGIHNVITKVYHMSVITLISRKICDKNEIYRMVINNIIESQNSIRYFGSPCTSFEIDRNIRLTLAIGSDEVLKKVFFHEKK